jgi:hypothetical protein
MAALDHPGLAVQINSGLDAKNVVLRHQVGGLRRQARGQIHFTNLDRLILVELYNWFPSTLQVRAIVQPKTVIR